MKAQLLVSHFLIKVIKTDHLNDRTYTPTTYLEAERQHVGPRYPSYK